MIDNVESVTLYFITMSRFEVSDCESESGSNVDPTQAILDQYENAQTYDVDIPDSYKLRLTKQIASIVYLLRRNDDFVIDKKTVCDMLVDLHECVNTDFNTLIRIPHKNYYKNEKVTYVHPVKISRIDNTLAKGTKNTLELFINKCTLSTPKVTLRLNM
jgi:hypothetical protein